MYLTQVEPLWSFRKKNGEKKNSTFLESIFQAEYHWFEIGLLFFYHVKV